MSKKSNIKFDDLLKVIPGTIIFYCFLFHYSYYDQFNVDVVRIMSIEELLLSFLPLVRFVLLFAAISLAIPAIMLSHPNYFNSRQHVLKIQSIYNKMIERKSSRIKGFLALFKSFAIQPMVVFFMIHKLIILADDFFIDNEVQSLIIAFFGNAFFVISIYFLVELGNETILRYRELPSLKIALFFGFFLYAKLFTGMGEITSKLDKGTSTVSFKYNDENIVLDDHTIAVGITKSHIVLRDTLLKENQYYEMSNITCLKIRESD